MSSRRAMSCQLATPPCWYSVSSKMARSSKTLVLFVIVSESKASARESEIILFENVIGNGGNDDD